MSRIGNKPVPVPSGVKVAFDGAQITLTGPKGSLNWRLPPAIQAVQEGGEIVVKRGDDTDRSRALHGLSRALIANMVIGVHTGYTEKLEVYGTGYSAKLQGKELHLNVGFSGRGYNKPAQFIVPIPDGINVEVAVQAARGENEPAKFTISGIDKQQVGQFAAEVRKLRKPEPYKGKGIRYAGEAIKRKAGKVFAGGGS